MHVCQLLFADYLQSSLHGIFFSQLFMRLVVNCVTKGGKLNSLASPFLNKFHLVVHYVELWWYHALIEVPKLHQ